jgi:hypothetical protein
MKKFLCSAAVAVATLVGAAAPSFAATVTTVSSGAGADGVYNLGTFSSAGGASFRIEDIASAAVAGTATFMETFYFILQVDANATITQGVTFPALTNFDVTVSGPAGSVTSTGGGGGTGFAVRFYDLAATAAGTLFNMVVTGDRASATALAAGSISFDGISAPSASPVPLPGALLLMGSVLMGGAGLAKWRKGGSRLAA